MRGDLDQGIIDTHSWTDALVQQAGIPIVDVPFVTVGSGIGSFVTYDTLRTYGVPSSAMVVLGTQKVPWSSYEYLTRVSRGERLRSDSAPTPDNLVRLLVRHTTIVLPEYLRPSLIAFLMQFIVTWMAFWIIVNGPMRVPFHRWRLQGGRYL